MAFPESRDQHRPGFTETGELDKPLLKSLTISCLNRGLSTLKLGQTHLTEANIIFVDNTSEWFDTHNRTLRSGGFYDFRGNAYVLTKMLDGYRNVITVPPEHLLFALLHEGVHRETHALNNEWLKVNKREIWQFGYRVSYKISDKRNYYYVGLNEVVTDKATELMLKHSANQLSSALPAAVNVLERADSPGYKDYYAILDVVIKQVATRLNSTSEEVWKDLIRGLLTRRKASYVFETIERLYGEEGLIMLGMLGVNYQSAERSIDLEDYKHRSQANERNNLIRKFFTPFTSSEERKALVEQVLKLTPEAYRAEAKELPAVARASFQNKHFLRR